MSVGQADDLGRAEACRSHGLTDERVRRFQSRNNQCQFQGDSLLDCVGFCLCVLPLSETLRFSCTNCTSFASDFLHILSTQYREHVHKFLGLSSGRKRRGRPNNA